MDLFKLLNGFFKIDTTRSQMLWRVECNLRRMHYDGFQIAQIDRISFTNMYDMLWAKVDQDFKAC